MLSEAVIAADGKTAGRGIAIFFSWLTIRRQNDRLTPPYGMGVGTP
jgi:hypothetical protein